MQSCPNLHTVVVNWDDHVRNYDDCMKRRKMPKSRRNLRRHRPNLRRLSEMLFKTLFAWHSSCKVIHVHFIEASFFKWLCSHGGTDSWREAVEDSLPGYCTKNVSLSTCSERMLAVYPSRLQANT